MRIKCMRVARSRVVRLPNKSFQPTRPLVTLRAGPRTAPIVLAAEANVRQAEEIRMLADLGVTKNVQ